MLELSAYGNSYVSTWWFLRIKCISWTNHMHFRCALCEAQWVLSASKAQRSQDMQTHSHDSFSHFIIYLATLVLRSYVKASLRPHVYMSQKLVLNVYNITTALSDCLDDICKIENYQLPWKLLWHKIWVGIVPVLKELQENLGIMSQIPFFTKKVWSDEMEVLICGLFVWKYNAIG